MNYITAVEDKVYQAISKSLKDLSGKEVTTIFSYLGIPEPKDTYCAIHVLDIQQFGGSDESKFVKANSEEYTTITHFTTTVQISFVGKDSGNLASMFHLALRSDHRLQDSFGYSGVKQLKNSNLRRSPSLRETGWVDGWNLDLTLTFAIEFKYKFDWAEYLGVNGEYKKIPYNI